MQLGQIDKDASATQMPGATGLNPLGLDLMQTGGVDSKLHTKYTFMPIQNLQKSISTAE
jgi:hypothetical protein